MYLLLLNCLLLLIIIKVITVKFANLQYLRLAVDILVLIRKY